MEIKHFEAIACAVLSEHFEIDSRRISKKGFFVQVPTTKGEALIPLPPSTIKPSQVRGYILEEYEAILSNIKLRLVRTHSQIEPYYHEESATFYYGEDVTDLREIERRNVELVADRICLTEAKSKAYSRGGVLHSCTCKIWEKSILENRLLSSSHKIGLEPWQKLISHKIDFEPHPGNREIWDVLSKEYKIKYDGNHIFWSEISSKTEVIFIKMNGHWIPIDASWLNQNSEVLPQEVYDEALLVCNISK